MQLLSGALHLGAITDLLLRWPKCSLHIWPSGSSAGSKQFRQKKNDNLCPAILTIQITASNVSPLRSYPISFSRAPSVILVKGFLATDHVNIMQNISIKLSVSGILQDCYCGLFHFTGVCSVNMLSV